VRRAGVPATIRSFTAGTIMKDAKRAASELALASRFLKEIGMPMLLRSLRFETWIVAIQALTVALTRRSLVRRF
jgi:hypothetical protein